MTIEAATDLYTSDRRWNGQPIHECRMCLFGSLNEDSTARHVLARHTPDQWPTTGLVDHHGDEILTEPARPGAGPWLTEPIDQPPDPMTDVATGLDDTPQEDDHVQ